MLYISNATTQHFTFQYRDPVSGKVIASEIGSGQQVVIGHGWTAEQKAVVINALHKIGARDAAEVHKTVKKFHGLIYRDGAPVSSSEILMGNESVKKMQNDRSVEAVVTSALGADRVANPQKGKRATKKTAIEVEQVIPPGQRPTGDETKFGLEVTEDGGASRLKTESL